MITQYAPNIKFIHNSSEIIEKLTKEHPAWINEIREEGISYIKDRGFPTTKDEDWKYTNISSLLQNTYQVTKNSTDLNRKEWDQYTAGDTLKFVFVNGDYAPELSNPDKCPKGITIMPLEEAFKTHKEEIKQVFDQHKHFPKNSFAALSQAFIHSGTFLLVDKNVQHEDFIHIIHVAAKENNIAVFPRTVIFLQSSSEVTVLESHVSFGNQETYLSSAKTDIYLSANATLHYCKAQQESLKSYHIGNTRVFQERDSHFDGFSFMNGGLITRNNLDVVLNAPGAGATLNGLYSLNGNMHTDNHTTIDHRHPNGTSNQFYKGILNGTSRAVFNGKIIVRPIAQQTNSYQLNKNLILGSDCRVDTKPQLEIFADDVKCSHGATIGQLNEDEIFYLQTRCIKRKDAIQTLARGFIEDLLQNIKNYHIYNKLHICAFAQGFDPLKKV